MNEQKVVQEILYMLYLFQKEKGTMLKARPKPEEMNHREIMVLQAICRMHPDGTPVKMSDLSAFFRVTPAAVSQTIRAFERKEWVERVRPEHDRRTVYIRVSEKARAHMQECMDQMQSNLQSFVAQLGEEDAAAMVRILKKAIDFYRDHHDREQTKLEGESEC